MSNRIEVLDHGYVELVGHMGSDEEIVRSARMSTQKGFLGWGPTCNACGGDTSIGEHLAADCPDDIGTKPGDEKLLRYLWENAHATPFEFCAVTFEVRAPIFVFREWHRHRTQSFTEASARYSPLEAIDFVPTVERCVTKGVASNKQAASIGEAATDEDLAHGWIVEQARLYREFEAHYQAGLKMGIPKEIARIGMPVGRYSKMRASTDLRNWLGFLKLRQAPNAQLEIRVYADAVAEILKGLFPRTMAIFGEVCR